MRALVFVGLLWLWRLRQWLWCDVALGIRGLHRAGCPPPRLTHTLARPRRGPTHTTQLPLSRPLMLVSQTCNSSSSSGQRPEGNQGTSGTQEVYPRNCCPSRTAQRCTRKKRGSLGGAIRSGGEEAFAQPPASVGSQRRARRLLGNGRRVQRFLGLARPTFRACARPS